MTTTSAFDAFKTAVSLRSQGQWVYSPTSSTIETVPKEDPARFDAMGVHIATVHEHDSDGLLIAAAPRLLAALEGVEAVARELEATYPSGWIWAAKMRQAVTEALS